MGLLLFAFIIGSQGIELLQINQETSLSEIFWEEREIDILLQPIIIFSSLIGSAYLIGGRKWKY
jgi:hypothetical protein